MDSVGIGELPDAAAYGDQGSNTLGNIARRVPLQLPTLRASASTRRRGRSASRAPRPQISRPRGRRCAAAWRKRRPGKDSVTGHWEMMGIVLDRAFPMFPDGFPPDIIAEFSRQTGRGVLGNKAASGTDDHRRARRRAHAHRRADRLHVGRQRVSDCRARRDRAGAGAVSRVRDRLQAGRRRARRRPRHRAAVRRRARASSSGPPNRHDYALPPSGETLLDRAEGARGCRSSRSARSRICSPAAASPTAVHTVERRRRDGPGRASRWRRSIAA